ncbi:DUF4880 domain-containing protein [Dongia sp.]|uniref:FecR family protein n=1 Tax=Dongia sp. TaxID=1977262 RepID=UPI0035B03863
MARAGRDGIATGDTASLTDQAAFWFVRLRDESLSAAERAECTAWLARSPAHAAAMSEMAEIWRALDAASYAASIAPPPAGRSVARRKFLAAGLGLSSLAAVAGWSAMSARGIRAPLGGRLRVDLASDAALELDSFSALEIGAREPHPSATLRHGQVYVQAMRPAGRFIALQVPFGEVRAEQAGFNLKLERRRALVSVLSGRVEIHAGAGGMVEIGPLTTRSFGAELHDDARPIAPARVAPWRAGRLIFERTLLADAIDDLNRCRPGHIMIGDPRLDDLLVTGSFDTAHCDAALESLLGAFSLKRLNLGGSLQILFRT